MEHKDKNQVFFVEGVKKSQFPPEKNIFLFKVKTFWNPFMKAFCHLSQQSAPGELQASRDYYLTETSVFQNWTILGGLKVRRWVL